MKKSELKKIVREVALNEDDRVQVIGMGKVSKSILYKNLAGTFKELSDFCRAAASGEVDTQEIGKIGPAQLEVVLHKFLTLRAVELGAEQPKHTKIMSK